MFTTAPSGGHMGQRHKYYLLLLCTLQVPPLLDGLAQVDRVHGQLHLPDDVVFGEAVEVIH